MKTEIKVDGNGRNTALLLATAVAAVLVTTSASAESKTTHFTGEEIALSQVQGDLFFNSPELYILNRELTAREEISDPRLKGGGYFKYTVTAYMATGQAEFWGTARIVPDKGGGEWNGYFVADMGAKGHGIQMTVEGTGDYEGLVARLDYKTVDDKLLIVGYVEVRNAPKRTFRVDACRTERIENLTCMVLNPETWEPYDPPVFAPLVRVEILQESGTATHFGRKSSQGRWILNPLTGSLSGAGESAAANGDTTRWVCLGSLNPEDFFVRVGLCAGTGRFEAVVGEFDVTAKDASLQPTEDPTVFLKTYCYSGVGTINY